MGLVKYESYYIKTEEIYILLAGLEIPCIYGIASNKEAIPEKQEMNRILIDLYQKQIIDWEDESITIKQPYTDTFYVISTCKRCVVIKGGGGNSSIQCCYLAKEAVVITEISQREEEMFCVSYMSYGEWLLYIEEYLETERKYSDTDIKMILEIRDSRNGKEYGKLTIKEQGLETVITEQFAQKEKQYLYEKEVLAELLKV